MANLVNPPHHVAAGDDPPRREKGVRPLTELPTSEQWHAAQRELADLKEQLWMADACLNQVREWLAAQGLNVAHIPPMFYPEALQAVKQDLARVVRQPAERPDGLEKR